MMITDLSETAPPREPRLRRLPLRFLLMVALPTLAAAIYFLLLAAPIYVSEAKFLVRTPAESSTLPTMDGLNTVLEGVGLRPTDTDAFAVHNYIISRNAVADVGVKQLRDVFARPEADLFSRFPRPFQRDSDENLFKAYKRFVTIGYDTTTGVSTLTVRAFRPQDAQVLTDNLLDRGEMIVNRLNDQAESDAVTETMREMDEARVRVEDVQARLTQYRNQNQIVDPEGAGTVGLELVAKLGADLAVLRAERNALAASTPQSPQLPGLDQRILAYERQLASAQSQIAGERGSLATKVGGFERLALEREFLTRTLASAVTSVEQARSEARRKQLYLQRVVEPVVPDSAEYPRRLRNILLVFVTALMAYAALVLISAGLKEHRQ